MDQMINVSVTPIQALLALAFEIWIIVFPIILIQKLNYLTRLVHQYLDKDQEVSEAS